ncbi:hypothetical protein HYU95_04980 [Candidatus Daviesbacteria bacterium]|nr:hypothetical protein [Candidatus Daviesbacteria bacterium]
MRQGGEFLTSVGEWYKNKSQLLKPPTLSRLMGEERGGVIAWMTVPIGAATILLGASMILVGSAEKVLNPEVAIYSGVALAVVGAGLVIGGLLFDE